MRRDVVRDHPWCDEDDVSGGKEQIACVHGPIELAQIALVRPAKGGGLPGLVEQLLEGGVNVDGHCAGGIRLAALEPADGPKAPGVRGAEVVAGSEIQVVRHVGEAITTGRNV